MMTTGLRMTIRGHPKYTVTSDGYIINSKGHKMTPRKNKDGYLIVRIYENGRYVELVLHRIVALHFISNPDNLPQVNHKDGNKDNCDCMNLEWCTGKHNTKHSYDTDLHEVGEVIQLLDNIEVARYKNAKIASEVTGIRHGNIITAISREGKSGGYHWMRENVNK